MSPAVSPSDTAELRALIRTIPDYPKPGILFRDVTTLFGDPAGLARTIELLAAAIGGEMPTQIAGIEARGFVLAGAVAIRVGAGFIPVRKKGKLPHTVIGRDYDLEYGTDRVEPRQELRIAPFGGREDRDLQGAIAAVGARVGALAEER